MFCSGSILQTFMISVGISDTTISVYNAVIQLAQAISIIVMLFVADKIKNTIRTFSFVIFSISLIAISLFVCIFLRSDVLAVKLVIFISSIFAYLMIGVKYSLDYRVLYEVFEVGNTGKILGISVAISGLVAFGFSAIYRENAVRPLDFIYGDIRRTSIRYLYSSLQYSFHKVKYSGKYLERSTFNI